MLLYKAILVNGSLVEITLPVIDGATRYSRPVFGQGKIRSFDRKGVLIALGAK